MTKAGKQMLQAAREALVLVERQDLSKPKLIAKRLNDAFEEFGIKGLTSALEEISGVQFSEKDNPEIFELFAACRNVGVKMVLDFK